jgi:hypothetical protein
MSKFVDYGERWGLYRSVVFWILIRVVYTHPFIFPVLCFFIHGVSMSTTSYIFLGGVDCNKCLSENVMLYSVNTGCEQWCDNLKTWYVIMWHYIDHVARMKEQYITTGSPVSSVRHCDRGDQNKFGNTSSISKIKRNRFCWT